jgi:hypothetical protein
MGNQLKIHLSPPDLTLVSEQLLSLELLGFVDLQEPTRSAEVCATTS